MRILFRKRFNEIIEHLERIDHRVRYQSNDNQYLTDNVSGVITSQQRTIEQLTKALCNKYERGLFIFSEDGKVPMVIRNGKELTNDMTTFFSIEWSPGEVPDIHIDQIAATHHDMEE